MVVILSVADLGTPIVHAFDSYITKGNINVQLMGLAGIVGMVSRILESYIRTSLPDRAAQMTTVGQRNQILNFALNAIICKLYRKKGNALAAGYSAVTSDLTSQYITEQIFGADKTLLELPMTGSWY